MQMIELPVDRLKGAPWNANIMDESGLLRLKESLRRYGVVVPLVVRPMADGGYEVLSGNQRLKVLREMGFDGVPCVVVQLDDAGAMLLAQALNGIHGDDDLALKGALLREVLSRVSEDEVLSLLPETTESLRALSSIGEADLARHLRSWQDAQAARLSHLQLQLTRHQLEVVEEALASLIPEARGKSFSNPNVRGNALFLLCKFYLEKRKIR